MLSQQQQQHQQQHQQQTCKQYLTSASDEVKQSACTFQCKRGRVLLVVWLRLLLCVRSHCTHHRSPSTPSPVATTVTYYPCFPPTPVAAAIVAAALQIKPTLNSKSMAASEFLFLFLFLYLFLDNFLFFVFAV